MVAVNAAPPQTALITGDELYARGDTGPAELVEGKIVPMSPTGDEHGAVELNFGAALKAFVAQGKLGKVRVGEVGIYTGRHPDTVRAADALFISNERYAQRRKTAGYLDIAPDLIVEILSPDDRWFDITQTLREYFAIAVRLVWVADPSARTVFAYRSLTDVREFTENDALPGDDVLPGFSVAVASLFAE
jgi:Uma2 family endonuclease